MGIAESIVSWMAERAVPHTVHHIRRTSETVTRIILGTPSFSVKYAEITQDAEGGDTAVYVESVYTWQGFDVEKGRRIESPVSFTFDARIVDDGVAGRYHDSPAILYMIPVTLRQVQSQYPTHLIAPRSLYAADLRGNYGVQVDEPSRGDSGERMHPPQLLVKLAILANTYNNDLEPMISLYKRGYVVKALFIDPNSRIGNLDLMTRLRDAIDKGVAIIRDDIDAIRRGRLPDGAAKTLHPLVDSLSQGIDIVERILDGDPGIIDALARKHDAGKLGGRALGRLVNDMYTLAYIASVSGSIAPPAKELEASLREANNFISGLTRSKRYLKKIERKLSTIAGMLGGLDAGGAHAFVMTHSIFHLEQYKSEISNAIIELRLSSSQAGEIILSAISTPIELAGGGNPPTAAYPGLFYEALHATREPRIFGNMLKLSTAARIADVRLPAVSVGGAVIDIMRSRKNGYINIIVGMDKLTVYKGDPSYTVERWVQDALRVAESNRDRPATEITIEVGYDRVFANALTLLSSIFYQGDAKGPYFGPVRLVAPVNIYTVGPALVASLLRQDDPLHPLVEQVNTRNDKDMVLSVGWLPLKLDGDAYLPILVMLHIDKHNNAITLIAPYTARIYSAAMLGTILSWSADTSHPLARENTGHIILQILSEITSDYDIPYYIPSITTNAGWIELIGRLQYRRTT